MANGLMFIGSSAFDTNGKANCSGTPAVCNPLWTGPTGTGLDGPPTIANGKVYLSDIPFVSAVGGGFRHPPLRLGTAAAHHTRR